MALDIFICSISDDTRADFGNALSFVPGESATTLLKVGWDEMIGWHH